MEKIPDISDFWNLICADMPDMCWFQICGILKSKYVWYVLFWISEILKSKNAWYVMIWDLRNIEIQICLICADLKIWNLHISGIFGFQYSSSKSAHIRHFLIATFQKFKTTHIRHIWISRFRNLKIQICLICADSKFLESWNPSMPDMCWFRISGILKSKMPDMCRFGISGMLKSKNAWYVLI